MARPAPRRPGSVHDAYVAHGARGYYERFGDDYRNPHEPVIADLIAKVTSVWPLDVSDVLDLAAGSGEVTLALLSNVARVSNPCLRGSELGSETRARISAIDPFTAAAYQRRTGQACEVMTFEQIAAGGLRGRAYSLIVCSFALHLAELSRLPALCWELAAVAGQLLILTPHKRPAIDAAWGWSLTLECLHERVRARLYFSQPAEKGLS